MIESFDLLDPKKICGDKYDHYNEKLRIVKTVLARAPRRGGLPFIHAFSMNKPHIIDDTKITVYVDEKSGKKYEVGTAATDGKRYFWHIDMLENLDPFELTYIMAHETYHMILQHCDPDRNFGKIKFAWASAIDYVVNAMVERDIRSANRVDLGNFTIDNPTCGYSNGSHPMWGGNLGKPLQLKDLIKQLKQSKKNTKKRPPPQLADNPLIRDMMMYCDYSQYDRAAEEIYREIVSNMDEEDKDDAAQFDPGLFGMPMDEHRAIDMSRQELLDEVFEAATACEKMQGDVPSAIKDKLAELKEPKLTWQDIVRTTLQVRRDEKGKKNDWSRFRRREIVQGFYVPKKKSDFVRWLAMLDTSGSMSPEDMAYGISQLKALDGRSEGIVVPCDAKCYWENAIKINSMSDLPNINPVGRGGTAFDSFFNEYEKQLGNKFDVIIIMTDGYVGTESLKRPHTDCVWVITDDSIKFKAPFGRVAPMRRKFGK